MLYPDYCKSFKYNLRYNILKLMPNCFHIHIIKYKYEKFFKRTLNSKFPIRLSEKLQLMKLYDNSPQKTLFADKLQVKEYIKNNLPELKFAKVFQSADFFEELDFKKLPESFLLKTTPACPTNTFIANKNKIDTHEMKYLKKSYNKVLKINYAYWSYYEMHYKNIKPRIFAEEALINKEYNLPVLPNYEVYCFNGKPEFIIYRVFLNGMLQSPYNTLWEKLDFNIAYESKITKEKPIFLAEMLDYCKILAKNFIFVRIDFFEKNNELFFGEMTFTPFSGFIKFIPDIFDFYYGNKINTSQFYLPFIF